MVIRPPLGEQAQEILELKLRELDINIVPFTPEHATEATRAFDRFGKGNHPAKPNFGDCVAYALAKVSGQARPFVGDDFAKTDVRAA